jgi:hypothetical protein
MTTLALLAAPVARSVGGDGAAAVFTATAAPVQLSLGQLLLVILALAVLASVIGGLAAIAYDRVHDPRNHTETDGP